MTETFEFEALVFHKVKELNKNLDLVEKVVLEGKGLYALELGDYNVTLTRVEPEPVSNGYCSKEDCLNSNPTTHGCMLPEPRKSVPEFGKVSCLDYAVRKPEPPCPVCGKPASEHRDGLFCCGHCGGEAWFDKAKICGCPGWKAECRHCAIKTRVFANKTDAEADWNRRA